MNSKRIAIIGAGIAGSSAAIRLKHFGHEVFLIERNEVEPFSIGESIPGATLRLLNTLGFQQMENLLPAQYFRINPAIASAWGGDEWIYKDGFNSPEGGGWQISRSQFDAALRNKAINSGSNLIPAQFVKVRKDATHFQLDLKTYDQKAQTLNNLDCLIDASGRSASLLRKFGIKHQRFQTQMAVFGWFRISEEPTEISKLKTTSEGWWYTSLLPDQIRVIVFHGLPKYVARYLSHTELFLEAFNSTNILQTHVECAHLLTKLNTRDASFSVAEQFSGSNWLAVGDAALGFDPISAQGIFFALYSGIRGAEALAGSTHSDMENFSQKIHQIAQKNHSLQMQYYTAELRFKDEPYWSQYFEAFATL